MSRSAPVRFIAATFTPPGAAEPLFEALDATFDSGFTAVVGPNGAGKSTLLRLLAGELVLESGRIQSGLTTALVAQEVEQLDPAVELLAQATEGAAQRLRDRLHLEPATLDRWPTLSPGERKRWQVGAALHGSPELLLLDEPSNHLDREARGWLIEALKRFRGTALLVSHDRELLAALCSRTAWVERGRVEAIPLPFEEAVAEREARHGAAVERFEAGQQKARRLEAQQVAARATLESATRGRSTRERMRNRHDSDARTLGAAFRAEQAEMAHAGKLARLGSAAAKAGSEVESLRPEGLRQRGHALTLFPAPWRSPWPLQLERHVRPHLPGSAPLGPLRVGRLERIALTGPNGAGKTTLLQALAEAGEPLLGEALLHLPQELSLEARREVGGQLRALPSDQRGRVLAWVDALGVDPDRLLKSALPSPGEARKAWLALGLGTPRAVLLLDEPTHHLDLPAVLRLEEALAGWGGALVLVTHDARMERTVATRSWALTAEGLIERDVGGG